MDFRKGLRLPTLTKHIKGILEQYPDDGQILKELIQNADDAGAKTVRFVLDEGHYESSPEGLIHPDMEQFQGPSLLVYNDAVFSEDDWNGICMIEESIKEKDVIQTGRFGLGFKSIFHVTDLPIILSGDYIGIIDPHQKYLPGRESAWNWHLNDHRDFLQGKREQLGPLFKGIFGLDADILSNGNKYNHTVFRFPLRRQANQLSTNIYNAEKVLQLFQSLEIDKGQSLLFLKSVQCIEIYRQSYKADEPKLVYQMRISESTAKQVSERRQVFLQKVRQEEWRMKPAPVETILKMTVQVEHFQTEETSIESHDWLIYHICHGDKAVIDTADELNILPWVGIALPIPNSTDRKDQICKSAGHLFATLPLPLDGTEKTGLPFHVHAYFAMEQNRRHIRWPTPDQNQEGLNNIRLQWNQLLVRQCIPAAVLAFFRQVISSLNSEVSIAPDDLYELLPNESIVDAKWRPLVSCLYKHLFTGCCLHSPAPDKGWLKVEETFHCKEYLPEGLSKLLKQVLLKAGFPVTNIPPHIQAAVKKYSLKQQKTISALDVHNATLHVTSNGNMLERGDALLLLHYFLDNGRPQELIGLPLLPLLSGEMAAFHGPGSSAPVFLSSKDHPATLLPGQEQRLVDTALGDHMLSSLQRLCKTGQTQVKELKFRDVLEILPQVLQSSETNFDIVPWSPDDGGHPSLAWLEQLWAYIQLKSPSSKECEILENLHLLPIDNCQLSKLSVGKRVILGQTEENVLPEGVVDFLSEVGCIILRESPDFVYSHKDLLYRFIHLPTCQGVIDALMSVAIRHGESFNAKVKQARSLNDFVTYISDSGVRLLSSKAKQFLLGLPLFSTLNGSGFQPSRAVSLNEVKLSGPPLELPIPFPVPVINVHNEKVRYILEALGMHRYHRDSTSQVVKKILLPAMKTKQYTVEQVETLLCHLMDHHPKVILDHVDIAREISELAFVEAGLRERQSPRQLYDPRDPILSSFLGREFFPHQKYHTSERLASLEKLGMRPLKQISSAVFLGIAKSLQTQPERSDDFIQLTKTLSKEMPHGKWWEKLRDVAFLSAVQLKPNGYPTSITWKGSGGELLAPREVCHIRFAQQAGSVVPFVDLDETILTVLQAKISPNLDDLISHLKNIIKNYNDTEKTRYLVLLDNVYSGLAAFRGAAVQNALDRNSVSSWIWCGSGFKCAGQMLLEDLEIDVAPYYYTLPSEMRMHQDLMHRCGVPNSVDLGHVLKDIADKHMEEESQNASNARHDLHLAIKLLEVLCTEGTKTALIPIETPDASKLMFKPALECTVWDGSSEFDDDLFYVHQSVPKEVTNHFPIPTVMHRVLAGEEFSIVLESFGQNEPLTTRLSSVIEGYTDGLSVLKEMVQNADDAGATEVRLVYDMRENKQWRRSLLDPGMADWQGPSMWIYNNAVFTDDDFVNITKLNGGTKRDKEDQIGTFGLGFNAVYNLTDVPSVLSRDTLAIFDPHTTYLGRSVRDKTKPGLRINLGNRQGKLLSKYPDQFAPWKGICGCNLESDSPNRSFNGTLFRLPLRGHKQSTFSKISSIVYDEKNVLELLKMMYSKGKDMLLFTQNVLKVSVSLIPREETETDIQLKELFEIHKEPVQYLHEHGIQCEMSGPSQAADFPTQKFINECSILKASARSNNRDTGNRGLKSSMIVKSVLKTSEEGGLLLGKTVSKSEPHTQWIVSQSIEEVPYVQGITAKQQPVAGIAICLEEENGKYKIKLQEDSNGGPKGSYFSFLPLPMKSPLPFHINGTFILDQSRRCLVHTTDHDKHLVGEAWNKVLMSGAVCTAYMTALSDIISLTAPNEDLTSILPTNIKGDLITSMSETFWQRVIQDPEMFEVFLSPKGNVSLHDAYFLDQNLVQSFPDAKYSVTEVIRSVFQGGGRTLVNLPVSLEQTLRDVDPDMMESKIITEEVFFTSFFLPNMTSLPLQQSDRDNLLVKAIKSTSSLVKDTLKCKQCIPVSPDGLQVAEPVSLIHPSGRANLLYQPGDSKFPELICDSEKDREIVYERLCTLGMVRDNISWEEVLERSRNLTRVGPHKHKESVQYFLDYLRWKLTVEKDQIPEYIQRALQNERFLPTAVKPKDWTLPWKGEDSPSYKGSEIYTMKEPLIACTQVPILHKSMHISSDVGKFLGIKGDVTGDPVSMDVIKKQIQQITSNEENIRCASVRQSLEKIYQYLNHECVDTIKAEKVRQAFREEKFLIAEAKSVYSMQQKFVSPAACAFHPEFQAFPYINKVSSRYQRLFINLGIRDNFTCEQFLTSIATLEGDIRGTGLDETGLITVKQMLHGLCQQMQRENKTIHDFAGTPIYIPDAQGFLKRVEFLCYNDTTQIHTELEFPLVNSYIPNRVSAFLGVKELRAHVLTERSHGIAFPEDVNLLEELHSVLEAYPCGSQMLMELIQQADYAGATEIHFQLDSRKHSTRTVFNDDWKAMQGPSLCVNNDAKIDRDTLAGMFLPTHDNVNRHGAGMQSVYHLTDTPTVLAALNDGTETLCAYDPTCQHVEGTSTQEPAMMYEDVPLLRKFFPDVLNCYSQSEYGHIDGTCFRFPLRTAKAAKDSPICQSPVDIKDVDQLLENLIKEGYRALLFMTSLKMIKVSRLNRDTSRFETEVISSTVIENEPQIKDFRHYLASQKQTKGVKKGKFKKAAYALRLNKSSGKEEWAVIQHYGLQEGHQGFLSSMDLKMQRPPIGGVAELKHRNNDRHHQSLDHRYFGNRASKATPGSGDGISDASLLLPSYQRTNLPVQVFGQYQAVHVAKQNPASADAPNESWNKYITEVIARAYLDLIKSNVEAVKSSVKSREADAIQTSDAQIRQYYSMFPKELSTSSPLTQPIVKRLYELMTDEDVLTENSSHRTGTKWVTPSEACFLPEGDELKCHNVIRGANLCGLKIVKCPFSVQKMIGENSSCDPLYLSPDVLSTFLRNKQQCDHRPLSDLIKRGRTFGYYDSGHEVVKDMILFCQAEESFNKQLDEVPLLLTSDGRLRMFDQGRPVYKSDDIRLLNPCSKKFLHPDFVEIFKKVNSPVFKDIDIEGISEEFQKNFLKLAQNKVIPLDRSINIDWIEELWKMIDRVVNMDIQSLKDHCGHLSIWPVQRGRTKSLYPVNKMDEVFQKTLKWEHYLPGVLWPLHQDISGDGDIPISLCDSTIADSMVASILRPRSVLYALHHYHQQHCGVADIFKRSSLLKYFTYYHTNLTDDVDLLKDLPVYETLAEEYVSLTGNCVNVIPSQVPLNDMDAWTRTQQGILFLKEKSHYKDLYDQLGCVSWSIEEVYTEYIFKQLELLSREGRMIHMHYVLDHLGNKTKVLDALRNLECVWNIDYEFCKPSDLYDPTISLFEHMHEEDLPALDLSVELRLSVLRKAGMICTATKKMLAAYAKRPQREYNTHLILDYIRRHVTPATQAEYLRFLSKISFIPRQPSGNHAVCPDKSNENYVPLKGSVLVNHRNLVWAIAPLIQDYKTIFREDVLVSAGVIIEPPCELVARNIVQVCQHGQLEDAISIGNRRKLSGLIDTCYNHISTKIENGECTDQNKSELQDIMSDHCCIPVDQAQRFVKPNQAVLELTPNEEVKPYLYRLPDNMMNNKEVLKLLGIASKPNIRAYQRVLSMIHDKIESHAIDNDEDIQAAKQATRQVFKRIKKDRSLDVHTSLWLLSKSNCLYSSQSVIYSNNRGIESRLKRKMKLLVEINLKVSIESLLEYFPGTHRPQLLTSVVREEVQHEGEKSTESSERVKEHLASEAMDHGLQRLTYHIMVIKAEEDIDDTIDEKIAEVRGVIQKIQIASVINLKTRLRSDMGIIGDWQKKMVFAEQGTSTLYLECSSLEKFQFESSNCVYMFKVLADMVNDLNRGLFQDNFGTVLMAVLSATPEMVDERLDEMGIIPYDP